MASMNNGMPAFVSANATCIIEGNTDTGARLAKDVFVEVAENVLVGPTTNSPGQQFAILGIPVVLVHKNDYKLPPGAVAEGYTIDPEGRIGGGAPVNGFGYPVRLETVPTGDLSSAEGYLLNGPGGPRFYAHAIETTGGEMDRPADAPVDATVQRGNVTSANATTVKLEIRGGCTFAPLLNTTGIPRTQRMLVAVDNGTKLNAATGIRVPLWVDPVTRNVVDESTPVTVTNATCTEDLAAGSGNGTYRFRVDRYTISRTVAVPSLGHIRVSPQAKFDAGVPLERIGFK